MENLKVPAGVAREAPPVTLQPVHGPINSPPTTRNDAIVPGTTIPEAEWRERVQRHHERLHEVVAAHCERRSAGQKHPVIDFLFEYYRFRPSALLSWTPGVGSLLEDGADAFGARRHFEVSGRAARVSTVGLNARRVESTRWILALLRATQDRVPHMGCSGLHEWAMVHRASDRRHPSEPLRLSETDIADLLQASPLTCTHFDAYRFFTPAARPLNRVSLTASDVMNTEQPGCLHANMDVYRWAMKRHPWVPGELIADAFLLALEIRHVDMRASPYDLYRYGLEPIPVETSHGRAEYRRHQRAFMERARPIRQRLIASLSDLLTAVDAKPTYE